MVAGRGRYLTAEDGPAGAAAAEFEAERPLLFGIAYRMLGSVMDAEDMVQDTFLRYEATPRDSIRSLRDFLCTVVTRLSINRLSAASTRRERYVGAWLPEPIATDSSRPSLGPLEKLSQDESISIAFMIILESLSPAQRAVFILREVFDHSYEEIAETLGRSEAACRKLLSRAKSLIAVRPGRYPVDASEHSQLIEQFSRAAADGDLSALTAILADEATLVVDGGGRIPGAAMREVRGRDNVARFLLGGASKFTPSGARATMTEVNGQPALLVRDAQGAGVFLLSIEALDGRIARLWALVNPEKLRHL